MTPTASPISAPTADNTSPTFVERRGSAPVEGAPIRERRQFANSYDELSPPAQELAMAIDQYKLRHRRRFITYEEMLSVFLSLGYTRND